MWHPIKIRRKMTQLIASMQDFFQAHYNSLAPLLLISIRLIAIIGLSAFILQRSIKGKAAKNNQKDLSSLPGPRGLPLFGNFFDFNYNNLVAVWEHWALQYGPIYKFTIFGRSSVIVSDLKEIKRLMGQRPQLFDRGQKVEEVFKELKVHALFSETEPQAWRHSRQLVAPAFSTSRVSQMKGCIIKHALQLREDLLAVARDQVAFLKINLIENPLEYHKKVTGTGDSVSPLLKKGTLNLIIDVSFMWGNEKQLVENNLIEKIGLLFEVVGDRIFSPIPWHHFFKSKKDLEAEEANEKILQSIEKISKLMDEKEERVGSGGDVQKDNQDQGEEVVSPEVTKRTLLYSMMMARNSQFLEGKNKVAPMSEEKIKGNIFQVIMAGHETSSSTISWVLYFLSKHQDVQAKVREEVRSVLCASTNTADAFVPDEQVLNSLDLNCTDSFPYLNSVINETMRLKTVSPYLLNVAREDVTVLGHELPKGTEVFLLLRHAAMYANEEDDEDDDEEYEDENKHNNSDGNAKFNPNIFKFNPDRWTSTPKANQKLCSQNLFFGYGPRICPGRHLAQLEMTLFLAISILSTFRIETWPMPPCFSGDEIVTEVTKFTMVPDGFYPLLIKD